MLRFAVFSTISGGSEHAFHMVFTSRNTFLTFCKKSRFFVVFDLVLAPIFGQISPTWEPKAFEKTPSENTSEKATQKDRKINLS